MEHLIAFNGFRGGNKGSVSSLPLSEYDKTIRYPWIHEMVLQIRGEKSIRSVDNADPKALAKAQQRIKGQLPFRCAHYAHFVDNKRRQDHIDPESFLFQTTVDVDEKELVDKALTHAKQLDAEEGPWKGALLHLEYSARKKLHIDIRMPIGMTIEETQRAYCEALGVPCDESCFSPERIIFITDAASEIYRSPHWYEVLPAEELARRREAFLKRGLSMDGRRCGGSRISQVSRIGLRPDEQGEVGDYKSPPTPSGTSSSSTIPSLSETPTPGGTEPENLAGQEKSVRSVKSVKSVKSVRSVRSVCDITSPTDKNLIAFDLFQRQAGLGEVNIDTQGSRHSSLLAIMSAGASRVMSEEDLKQVVAQKMPSFSQEHDCQQLIHDFYAKYADSSKPMSRDVIRINATAERMALGVKREEGRVNNSTAMQSANSAAMQSANSAALQSVNSAVGQADSSLFTLPSSLSSPDKSEEEYPAPPAMPEHLPKLVELLLSRTPDIYKPAVANAIFPPLATHLSGTTFRYIDNVDHEATLMCALLAGTGSGKNCVQMPINLIMADIRARDRENLEREKAWKDEVTRKGANKDKRKRPANLIIQEIDADMTNPAFVMRTAEAGGHFLYTSLNEIDQFDALKGQGNQQFRIMCLAFDPGNQYGQTRVGTQSVTERVTIRFNWNASTTVHKGQQYFSRVLTDGPISRINFCTIPEREIGDDIPRYGTYDDAFREQLRPYVERLCAASGAVECPEALALAEKLKDENADYSRQSQDRVFENLSFRANVIAYLKACVLYVANGCQWEPEMEDFIRWSEQYDLYCKMKFFGTAIADAEERAQQEIRRGKTNMLVLLPDEFTYQQVEAVRIKNGLKPDGTRKMINNWVTRGYIKRDISNGISLNKLNYIKIPR